MEGTKGDYSEMGRRSVGLGGGSFSAFSLTGLVSALAETQRKGQIIVCSGKVRSHCLLIRQLYDQQLSTVLPSTFPFNSARNHRC